MHVWGTVSLIVTHCILGPLVSHCHSHQVTDFVLGSIRTLIQALGSLIQALEVLIYALGDLVQILGS